MFGLGVQGFMGLVAGSRFRIVAGSCVAMVSL